MQVMQPLRHAILLTRLVLVWYVLSLGVAVASPLVTHQSIDLVCSSGGSMKWVAQGDDADAPSHTLDCPLCASIVAPPHEFNIGLTQPSPLAHALSPQEAAHIASVTAPPLPSRGPPSLFL